jgi:tyrosinase
MSSVLLLSVSGLLLSTVTGEQGSKHYFCGDTITGHQDPQSTVFDPETRRYEYEQMYFDVTIFEDCYDTVYLEACESDYDTWLYVYDEDGVELNQCDDCFHHGMNQHRCGNFWAGDLDIPTTNGRVPAGEYTFGLRGYNGQGGDFDMTVRCEPKRAECNANSPRHRMPWNRMNTGQRKKYIRGFQRLATKQPGEELSLMQKYTLTHLNTTEFNKHGTAAFFPWHRKFLHELETAFRDLGGPFSCFSMPYWDWTHPDAQELIINSGLGGDSLGLCMTGNSGFGEGDYEPYAGDCLVRDVQEDCYTFSTFEEIMDIIDSSHQYNEFWPRIESYPHGVPHVCIGGSGQFGNYASPDDPIFYLHHCFIDYLWALWQDCNDYDFAVGINMDKDVYYGDFDAEMRMAPVPVTGSSTAEDMMNICDLGVSYEKGDFWYNARVDACDNCNASRQDAINPDWFKDTLFITPKSPEERDPHDVVDVQEEIRDEIDAEVSLSHPELSKREHHEMVNRLWAKRICEMNEYPPNTICAPPGPAFTGCSGMPMNKDTNDIDISYSAMQSQPGLSGCMIRTRALFYGWAKENNDLIRLCAGCYDPFCDRSMVDGERCLELSCRRDRVEPVIEPPADSLPSAPMTAATSTSTNSNSDSYSKRMKNYLHHVMTAKISVSVVAVVAVALLGVLLGVYFYRQMYQRFYSVEVTVEKYANVRSTDFETESTIKTNDDMGLV